MVRFALRRLLLVGPLLVVIVTSTFILVSASPGSPFSTGARLSTAGVIVRHVVPNAVGPIVAYATLTVPSVILDEAFLSFLGLGVPPPEASWGVLVNQGVNAMAVRPLLLVSPAVLMAVAIVMLNVLSDALRDMTAPAVGR